MAGVQGSALAIAVCEAGGLGSLPMAMLTPDAMRAEVAAVRAATSRPFNVNFFCHTEPAADPAREAAWRATLAPYYRELGLDADTIPAGPVRRPFDADAADVVRELAPPVVSFHFGLPSSPLLDVVRRTGATILSSATTVDEARWLEERGVHAIIAQGLEAGGHRGHFLSDDYTQQPGTLALTMLLSSTLSLPVVAAGGIGSHAHAQRLLDAGAQAVQAGTAYLLSPESRASAVHRAALQDPLRGTAITNLFSGGAARGLVNRLMVELGPMSELAPAFPWASAALAPLRARAESRGDDAFSPLWAGSEPNSFAGLSAAQVTHRIAGRNTADNG